MSEALFEYKLIGSKIAVYSDRIIHRIGFGKISTEKSIPIGSVASIDIGGFYSQSVFVTTNGGEKIKFMVTQKNKEAFREAIYKAKEKIK